jgi:hypothetical protein
VARLFVRLGLVTALAVAIASTAGTARAGLLPILTGGNCGATTQPFAPFGDTASYYFTSNGGFESGSNGWTLSGGASVGSGNEPYYVHSRYDRSSLVIPDGGKALSPSLCFGTFYPGARFFASSPSGSGTVHVRVITRSLLGILSILDGGTYQVGSKWVPVQPVGTTFSQLAVLVGTKSMQLELTVTSGDVRVDDIYIDPFGYWA